jgi:hypothetical protein
MRSSRLPGWLAVPIVLAIVLAAGYGEMADAARFAVSVRGRDTLAWSVEQAGSCVRGGSGRQTVEFANARPVTLQIGRESSRGSQVLVFQHEHGGVFVAVHATVTREDNTTGSFTFHEGCEPLPAKDCGTQPLPHFAPALSDDEQAGFTLHGPYYPTGNPPFHNCLALVTPINLVGVESFYKGWEFGETLLSREDATMATRPVSPQALQVGRTYRFAAHRIVHLSDGNLHGFVISDDGGSGSPEIEIGQPETPRTDDTLGGGASITDNASWEITLKRVG